MSEQPCRILVVNVKEIGINICILIFFMYKGFKKLFFRVQQKHALAKFGGNLFPLCRIKNKKNFCQLPVVQNFF